MANHPYDFKKRFVLSGIIISHTYKRPYFICILGVSFCMLKKGLHRYILLIVLFFTNGVYTHAQALNNHGLYIMDAVGLEPAPYVNIYNTTTAIGAVSGIDGYGLIKYTSSHDPIIFSCIGFKTLKLSMGELLKMDTLLLEPQEMMMNEYSVTTDDDALLKLVSSLKPKGNQPATAKTYFLLETYRNNEQIEMVEVYFNGKYNGYKIDQLGYKEGRIALGIFDNRVFASTEISKAFYDFDIFRSSELFPKNPLQFDKQTLRKKYKFKLMQKYVDEKGTLVHAIKFFPKIDQASLFEGVLWVDSARSIIQKIQLIGTNMAVYPFVPLFSTDSLQGVNMEININFNEHKGQPVFNNLNFTYSFEYLPRKKGTYRVKSNAVLYAYDKAHSFILPYFDTPVTSDNDYRRISSAPYNQNFWKDRNEFRLHSEDDHNEVFFNRKDLINSQSFFSDYFNENKGFFQDPYLFWNQQRIRFRPPAGDSINNKPLLGLPPSSNYHLGIQMYMDINTVNDSVQVFTCTVYDPFATYYYFAIDDNADCFLNLYFDMVEISRRELEVEMKKLGNDASAIQTLYLDKQKEFKVLAEIFYMEVEHGTNKVGMLKWNEYVKDKLGIDNVALFELYK